MPAANTRGLCREELLSRDWSRHRPCVEEFSVLVDSLQLALVEGNIGVIFRHRNTAASAKPASGKGQRVLLAARHARWSEMMRLGRRELLEASHHLNVERRTGKRASVSSHHLHSQGLSNTSELTTYPSEARDSLAAAREALTQASLARFYVCAAPGGRGTTNGNEALTHTGRSFCEGGDLLCERPHVQLRLLWSEFVLFCFLALVWVGA